MKYFLLFIVCILTSFVAAHAQQDLRLWYKSPAKSWNASLPLGNGRLGAMPDCGIINENIVLNDITLWSGSKYNGNKKGASKYLPEIRKLIFEGKNAEANKLVKNQFLAKKPIPRGGKGAKVPYGCYEVLGTLHLKYNYGIDTAFIKAENYMRSLFLDSAIATCSYEINGITYHREYFTSFANDVIIIRLSADKPGKINFTLSLNRPERFRTIVRNKELDMSGQLDNGTNGKGMRYLIRVRIKRDGGQLIPGDSTLQIKDANTAIIYISSATNYRKVPYKKKTKVLLKEAMHESYKDELTAHVKVYQKLFDRASLNLGNKNLKQAALPTNERLAAFAKNPTDNGLPVLYFQFGRYLLISSTRPELLPPNLQGLWANSVQTPWNGDYHLDINIEMNHWPLEVTNLPMLNEAFYRLIKGMVKPGERTAKAYWNSKGWVAYLNTNVWGYTSPGLKQPRWGATVSGSGWLCQVLWNHYAFTQDSAYLRKIYPILKGAAEFYLNTLVKDPNNGWLVTAPSVSPENRFILPNGKKASVCAGPTIDNQIIRGLFTYVMKADKILDKSTLLTKKLSNARKRLPPNQIDKHGRLMEWLKPFKETQPHHRHMSPLWGLFPGTGISLAKTPMVAKAARKLMIRRGDISTGWSEAWKMNLWARLGKGNHAYKLLKDVLAPANKGGHTLPNLFDAIGGAGGPFQIDANFGACAGIAEMLIQSQNGYIEFLPALPDQWSDGHFSGLCVRGGGVVSATWDHHRIKSATFIAKVSNKFKIKIPNYISSIEIRRKGEVKIFKNPGKFINVDLDRGNKEKILFFE